MFLQRETVFIKSEENHRWPDGTYINNDSINAIMTNLHKFDVEFETQSRQKTYQIQKDEKLLSQNNR